MNIEEDDFSKKTSTKRNVRGISLPGLLNVLSYEGKTCKVIIKNKVLKGELYFKNGILVDAQIGEKIGEEAVCELLTLKSPDIFLEPFDGNREKTIDKSINQLLLDSEKCIDDINIKKTNKKRRKEMNIPMLKKAVETLKSDLGDGLLATDIWGLDGQPIVAFNSQPKASALFNRITNNINKTLKESGFPEMGKYYILDLVDNHMVVIILLGDFQWGMLINSKKLPLGLLLNVAIPNAIDAFEKSMTS